MKDACHTYQALISGRIDGELSEEQNKRLDEHLASCADCRAELESMTRLIQASHKVTPEPVPDEIWNQFMNGVYNRLERRTGWIILIVGVVTLVLFGIYRFIMDPWTDAAIKMIIAAPIIGLGILFVSVLRERLALARQDRYSRDIER